MKRSNTSPLTYNSGDSLDSYLASISKIPLITQEEEVQLAQRRDQGDTAAYEKLVNSNLRFVVSVAKKYQHRGLDLGDLIQEGNLGLLKAAEKFDPSHGVKFISYAVWWIRQSVLLALSQAGTVRVPTNVFSQQVMLAKLIEQEFNTGVGENEAVYRAIERFDRLESRQKLLSGNTVHEAWNLVSGKSSSLDSTTPDNKIPLMDRLAADNRYAADAEAEQHSLEETIADELSRLTPRKQKILRLYFGIRPEEYGLPEGSSYTLEQIGSMLGVTRERVRQIREVALNELRTQATKRIYEAQFDDEAA